MEWQELQIRFLELEAAHQDRLSDRQVVEFLNPIYDLFREQSPNAATAGKRLWRVVRRALPSTYDTHVLRLMMNHARYNAGRDTQHPLAADGPNEDVDGNASDNEDVDGENGGRQDNVATASISSEISDAASEMPNGLMEGLEDHGVQVPLHAEPPLHASVASASTAMPQYVSEALSKKKEMEDENIYFEQKIFFFEQKIVHFKNYIRDNNHMIEEQDAVVQAWMHQEEEAVAEKERLKEALDQEVRSMKDAFQENKKKVLEFGNERSAKRSRRSF